jgi:sugar lactone lactonase YvrE
MEAGHVSALHRFKTRQMINPGDFPVEVVLDHKCLLGEGPVWDPDKRTISWVDILEGEIHEFDTAQKSHRIIPVYQMIGSIALCTNGNYIAALQNGFVSIDRESGEIKEVIDPESHLPGNRFNDGKCDPAGRFWAGSMSLSENTNSGSLYQLENNYSCIKRMEGLTISNGLAWSIDHRTLYFIDTPTFEVIAFDYDKKTGSIANKRRVIEIEKKDGYPDGMTIDTAGMLWIAHWDGWQVTRWNPENGRKIGKLVLPVAKITSCVFGGENLGDLYISSAKRGLDKNELETQPLAGSLFIWADCGFNGVPAFVFKA